MVLTPRILYYSIIIKYMQRRNTNVQDVAMVMDLRRICYVIHRSAMSHFYAMIAMRRLPVNTNSTRIVWKVNINICFPICQLLNSKILFNLHISNMFIMHILNFSRYCQMGYIAMVCLLAIITNLVIKLLSSKLFDSFKI